MALNRKLGGKGSKTANSKKGGNSIRDKFKKRSSSVLEKTFNTREDRIKAKSGKSPFNKDLIDELGLKEFSSTLATKEKEKSFAIEILPPSYDENIPYGFEVPIHYNIGINNDAFVCPEKLLGKPCPRCEQLRKMYKINSETTDEMKKMFPADRMLYLIWDRSKELCEDEEPVYELSLYNAPKKAVHAEIQIRTRNKKEKSNYDISDISEDGDGRTVYFEVHTKGGKDDWPEYKGFELKERDEPIPDEILELLDGVIESIGEFKKHPLENFLHIATYDEIKEAMETDSDEEEEEEEKPTKGKGKGKGKGKAPKVDEEAVIAELDELKEELEGLSAIKLKTWCKKNGYKDVLEEVDFDEEDQVEELIEAIYESEYQKRVLGEDDIAF